MIGKTKRPEEEAETLKMLKRHTPGGSPGGKQLYFKYLEVGLRWGFFRWKIL